MNTIKDLIKLKEFDKSILTTINKKDKIYECLESYFEIKKNLKDNIDFFTIDNIDKYSNK